MESIARFTASLLFAAVSLSVYAQSNVDLRGNWDFDLSKGRIIIPNGNVIIEHDLADVGLTKVGITLAAVPRVSPTGAVSYTGSIRSINGWQYQSYYPESWIEVKYTPATGWAEVKMNVTYNDLIFHLSWEMAGNVVVTQNKMVGAQVGTYFDPSPVGAIHSNWIATRAQ